MAIQSAILINAEGKVLGRLASEIAVILRGKDNPHFTPHILNPERVIVTHTDAIRVTGRKPSQKLYRRHSGYLGNLKEETLDNLMRRDSRVALRHAVTGMLPKNRLRRKILTHLILFKGDKK